MKTKILFFINIHFMSTILFAQNTNTIAGLIPDGPYYETKGSLSVSGYYKDNLKLATGQHPLVMDKLTLLRAINRAKNGIYLK